MKKLAMWLMICLLMPCIGLAEIGVNTDGTLFTLGENVHVTVEGAAGQVCSYRLSRGGKTVFESKEVPVHEGLIRPREIGEYELTVTAAGEAASASFSVVDGDVKAEAVGAVNDSGVYVLGNRASVRRQGDVRVWQVFAPGPWTAETDADFIRLSDHCGASGDAIVITVQPTSQVRTGYVLFSCGEESLSVSVKQTADHDVDEDVSFEPITDEITVDGETVDTCFMEEDEAFFSVDATGPWQFETDADFLTITRTEEGILLQADEQKEQVQKGRVVLTCGMKNAYLYVYRVPESKGADVLEALISIDTAVAWQDVVQTRVYTTPDALRLTVAAPGYEETFRAAEYAQEADGRLLWQVNVPVRQAGEQLILYAAENEEGSGKKQMVQVNVLPEEAVFVSEEAVLVTAGNHHRLKFTATAAANRVKLMDSRGRVLGDYVKEDATLTPAGPAGEEERYQAWSLPVEAGVVPDLLQMGDERIPVSLQTVLTPEDIVLYSQCDGWWQNKKYSISNLEKSGCAVFSLAHAMQLLGYTGEEIQPERLAKTYSMALMKDGSGTMNSTLVGRAGDDFGFKTKYELIANKTIIRNRAREGAVFSFSVVNGHIACVAGLEEEENLCLVIDSAPSATFERKGNVPVYYRGADGAFLQAATPADIPGVEYCIETDSFSCAVYYMELDYVARRGVRLIQPK